MMPCSSGNSPTMAVSRSHLHSSAARSRLGASAPMRGGDVAGERGARGASCRRASRACAWKVTASSAAQARRERLLAVLLPEERRVGQARAHHALVACAHLGRIAALDVADGDERRQQRARARPPPGNSAGGPAASRSAPRAAASGSAPRSGRRAAPATRPAPSPHRAAHRSISARPPRLAATAVTLRADALAPRGEVRDHVAALAQRASRSAPGDAMRSGCGAWKRWPWVCCPAAVSSSVAGTTSVPYSITSQCTGRTNSRVARAPVHAPRDRQRIERRLHDPGQQLGRAARRLGADEEQERALALLEPLQRVERRRRSSRRRRARRVWARRRHRTRRSPAARGA